MTQRNRTWDSDLPNWTLTRNRTLPPVGGDGSTLSLDFSRGVIDPRVKYSRSGIATGINASGFVNYVVQDQPRFSYQRIGNTFVSQGLIVEQQSSNLLTGSQTFATSGGATYLWTDVNITRTAGQISPDGTANAIRFTANAANATLTHGLATAKPNTQRVWSAWIRRVSGTGDFQVSHTIGSPTWGTVVITSEWVRYQGLTNATQQQIAFRIVNSTDSVEIWGVQLETGTVASSYIPVTLTSLTRGQDQAIIKDGDFTSWFKQDGTLVINYFRGVVGAGDRTVISIGALENAFIQLRHASGSVNSTVFWTYGGITVAGLTGNLNKTAIAFESEPSIVRISTNSSVPAIGVTTDFFFSEVLVNNPYMNIGSMANLVPTSFTSFLNSGIQSITFYPQVFTDQELQDYTKA